VELGNQEYMQMYVERCGEMWRDVAIAVPKPNPRGQRLSDLQIPNSDRDLEWEGRYPFGIGDWGNDCATAVRGRVSYHGLDGLCQS